jgi:hypothetical protein
LVSADASILLSLNDLEISVLRLDVDSVCLQLHEHQANSYQHDYISAVVTKRLHAEAQHTDEQAAASFKKFFNLELTSQNCVINNFIKLYLVEQLLGSCFSLATASIYLFYKYV